MSHISVTAVLCFYFTERAEWVLLCAFRSSLPVFCALRRPVSAWDQGEVSVSHHKWISQAQLQRPGQKVSIADSSSVPAGWSVSFHSLVNRLFLLKHTVPSTERLTVTWPAWTGRSHVQSDSNVGMFTVISLKATCIHIYTPIWCCSVSLINMKQK